MRLAGEGLGPRTPGNTVRDINFVPEARGHTEGSVQGAGAGSDFWTISIFQRLGGDWTIAVVWKPGGRPARDHAVVQAKDACVLDRDGDSGEGQKELTQDTCQG